MMNVEFERQMTDLLGRDDYLRLSEALSSDPVIGIRPNKALGYSPAVPLDRVPWSSCGYRLPQRVAFTFDPLFHAGGYYVQEPSSMFVEQALQQALQGLAEASGGAVAPLVLDLCAAPGGKSTLLRSLLPDGSHLVANEPMAPRARTLLENIVKWGNPDVTVTSDLPETFGKLPEAFDVVAVDAPCSGEGMFRKDATAREQWSPALVRRCADLQRQIVGGVWPALRDGGYLVYSTCTYNSLEDEGNVAWMVEQLGAEVVDIPVSDSWGIVGNLMSGSHFPVYHFMPHRTVGEGFFLALLRKKGHYFPDSSDARLTALRQLVRVLFPATPDMDFSGSRRHGKNVRDKVRQKPQETFADVWARRFDLSPGLLSQKKVLAEIPAQMALRLHYKDIPNVELTYAEALRFLRREALTLSPDVPCGIVAVTYEGHPLGFANQLGSRANNLYPSAWRILSTHLPESFVPLVK